MSEARDAFEALVNAGVDEGRARAIVIDEVGTDPAILESVTVVFQMTVEVELERDDVEDLSEGDVDELVQRAEHKLDIDTYGVSLMSVDSAEVADINLADV